MTTGLLGCAKKLVAHGPQSNLRLVACWYENMPAHSPAAEIMHTTEYSYLQLRDTKFSYFVVAHQERNNVVFKLESNHKTIELHFTENILLPCSQGQLFGKT